MIIERPDELKRITQSKKWVLVYGRRKTGKTFLVERFVKHDEYFFVNRDRGIHSKSDGKTLAYDTFLAVLDRALADGKTAVVDEFQRLGDDFFDYLHRVEKRGKLILISSTLRLSKSLLSSRSALLGLFTEVPVGLISMRDVLRALAKEGLGKKEMVEFAVLLREPLAIDYFDRCASPREVLNNVVLGSIKTVPALIGEVFTEEERSISAVYEGVLRAIACGKEKSGEISSHVFSNRLISKDDPSLVSQYLSNMTVFGIVKKIGVMARKRFVYKHVSPLTKLFYYADEKYRISERSPGRNEMLAITNELMPRLVEDCLRETFAEKMGLTEVIFEEKDCDVDILLLRFRKPELAIEVKWGGIAKSDLEKAFQAMSRIGAPMAVLFVPDKASIAVKDMVVWDVDDIVTVH